MAIRLPYRLFVVVGIVTLTLLACVRIEITVPPAPAAIIPRVTPQPMATPQSTFTPLPVSKLKIAPAAVISTPSPGCLLPDLQAWQHISSSGSYTETESLASTRMQCHIARDSCAYHKLVGLINPDIVFKGEEEPPYNLEDVLMHPAMLQPLARLNDLVQAEWDGAYKLRVTDAYDSLLEHDPVDSEPSRRYSLHYEGRAIDLTLWPVDRSLYGRLCALAHCAGFDFVENEVTHCHGSIKAESLCRQCD